MIQTEYLKDGTLIKHYSDSGMMIKNEDGVIYPEAIDVVPCVHTYTETDEAIDGEDVISGDEFMAMIEEVI